MTLINLEGTVNLTTQTLIGFAFLENKGLSLSRYQKLSNAR